MSQSVNSALYAAAGNIARPSTYNATILFPEDLDNLISSSQYDILCSSITLPSLKNEVLEASYKGHKIPIKGRSDYDRTFSCTFIIDETHSVKHDFDAWISGIDATYTNPSLDARWLQESESSNLGEILINATSWQGSTVANYKFTGVFPTSVSGIEFNGESQSTILTLTVEFAFLFYEVSTPQGDALFLDKLVNDTIDSVTSAVKTGLNDIGNDIEGFLFNSSKETPGDKQVIVPNFNNKLKELIGKSE